MIPILDCIGYSSSIAIVKLAERIDEMALKDVVKMKATDPDTLLDVRKWCKATGNILEAQSTNNYDQLGIYVYIYDILKSETEEESNVERQEELL